MYLLCPHHLFLKSGENKEMSGVPFFELLLVLSVLVWKEGKNGGPQTRETRLIS